jgi:DNA-binding MarR family transcriptional regulator
MQELETLTALFDRKTIAILTSLANDNSKEGLYLREISKLSKVPDATTYRIIAKLVKAGIARQQSIKNLKLYTFNNNDKTVFLYRILKKEVRVVEIFVEKASAIPNVEAILLHGEDSSQRANILLIGNNIDPQPVKELCAMLNEKYKFVISPLTLTAEQFSQMSSMGLYTGKEKVLFKKQ